MRAGCWAPNPAATPTAGGATGRPFEPHWSAWPTTTAAAVTTATAHLSGLGGRLGHDAGRGERDGR
jgi:hypothetical protein